MQNEMELNKPVSFDEFPLPSYEQWKQAATDALKGAPFEKKMFTPTYEGITLKPIYTAEDVKELDECNSFPGEQDYLRGTKSANHSMWSIAQGIDNRCPKCAGLEIAAELAKGGTVIHPVLSCAAKHGVDVPEKVLRGVSISALADVEKLFAELDITKNELHIATGASSVPMIALIAAYAEKKGVKLSEVKGCIGADPIAALAADGSLPRSLDDLYDELAKSVKWAAKKTAGVRTILLRGSVYSSAGASAVEETACVLAEAAALIRALADRGVSPDEACSAIRIEVSLGANFFMEIARLRALRVLWSHVAKAFGAGAEACKANVIAENAKFTQTVYDPYVNILRSATQAFSGVVGGVDAMNIHPFDDAVRPSTEQSRRIARNQQVMMQTEFEFDAAVDPAGGSWYIESLTREFENSAWALFQKIEAAGGIVKALESGDVQSGISAVLASRLKKLATRSDRAVGTNMYANMAEVPLEIPEDDGAEFAAKRQALVDGYKSSRDEAKVAEAVAAVSAAKKDGCVICSSAAAFAEGATLSEVWNALGGTECGIKVQPLSAHRWTEEYEAVRSRTEAYIAKTGDNVKVFLANMGPIPQHKARADFSTGFFEVGHFKVLGNNGFATVEEAAEAAAASGADAAVICSTDATYPEIVPALAKLIKEKCPDVALFLAGAPAPEFKQSYVDAGVDDFIHVKANCLQILSGLQKKKGMC